MRCEKNQVTVYWLFSSGRERCDESYPLVRNRVERVSNDLVLVVHPKYIHPKYIGIDCVRMPIDRYVSPSSERIKVESSVLILIVYGVGKGLGCTWKIKTSKA